VVGALKLATPLPFTATTSSVVEPTLKATLPVGTPLPEAFFTVAERVMFAPDVTGLGVAVTVVVVATGPLLLPTVSVVDALSRPPQTIVNACVPVVLPALKVLLPE